MIECPVCCGNDVAAVFILSKIKFPSGTCPKALETYCTEDYLVSFPLSFDGNIISATPVCINCAQVLQIRKLDLNREPIEGFIPMVDLTIGSNLKIVKHMVNVMIGGGKKCYHTMKIMFAAFEAVGIYEWAQTGIICQIKEFFQSMILKSVHDRMGMAEGGNIVPMEKVFANMLEPLAESNLVAQQFNSAVVILNHSPTMPRKNYLTTKVFIRHIIEQYNTYLVNPAGRTIKRKIRSDLFEAPHGIPLIDKIKLVGIKTSGAILELFLNHKYVFYLLEKSKVVLTEELVTLVLACVCSLKNHQKLENQINMILSEKIPLIKTYTEGTSPTSFEIITEVKKSLAPDLRKLDQDHQIVPPFITPAGPSRLVCGCGFRFDTGSKFITDIVEAKAAHLKSAFGSVYPTRESAHFNLHATIREVCAKYPNITQPARKTVIEIMAKLYKKKCGDIYIEETCHKVVCLLRSFYRVKVAHPSIPTIAFGRTDHSNETLIPYEQLNAKNADYVLDYTPDPVLTAPFTDEEKRLFNSFY